MFVGWKLEEWSGGLFISFGKLWEDYKQKSVIMVDVQKIMFIVLVGTSVKYVIKLYFTKHLTIFIL